MKKTELLLLTVILLSISGVKGNETYVWSQLGTVWGETLGVAGVQVSLDSKGTPYVMTKEYETADYLPNKKGVVSVMSFKENTWSVVGKRGVTIATAAMHPTFFVNKSTDKIYVLSNEQISGSNGARVTVFDTKNHESVWTQLGEKAQLGTAATMTSVVIDNNQNCYIVYRDHQSQDNGYGTSYTYLPFVRTWNGTEWVNVGNTKTLTQLAGEGPVSKIKLKLDNNNVLYAVFAFENGVPTTENKSKIRVARFNAAGSGWEYVGGYIDPYGIFAQSTQYFNDASTPTTTIGFDADNTPYLAFLNRTSTEEKNGKPSLLKFNESTASWQYIGDANDGGEYFFSSDFSQYIDMDFYGNEAYFLYTKIGTEQSEAKAHVKKFNTKTGAWTSVSPAAGLTGGFSKFGSLTVDKSKRDVYVAVTDETTTDPKEKAVIWKLTDNSEYTSTRERFALKNNVYGGKGFITIQSAQGGEFTIYAYDGKIINKLTAHPGELVNINLSGGFYLVKDKYEVVKVVVR
jgi:hypothetical protein